ncbi:energy transducer TonB [Aeromonas sp. FDAARGOS 1409]|uniref:energy transducer TonB n=1 Tax=Aeromonas TaxID=642 RepID=UPI001C23A911|nr:energy transducer TonB [Aeromonas sp. FDAARGOS 1409]QXC29306.1 energy transducer TonB [Aeromonas sp. FDAARGOS 1409]
MNASAMRPAIARDKMAFGPVQLACLSTALVLHLAILWLVQESRPAPMTPPEPLTLSARWAGESSRDDAPAKAAAAPARSPAINKPAPVRQKVVRPVVKKPAPKPVPKAPPKPKPLPEVKPATQAQPGVPPVATTAPATSTSNSQSANSHSAPAKTRQTGTSGGSSAPIARDASLHNPEPPYPPESRRRGEEGRVVLKVRVSREGSAESVEVERSSGHRRLDMTARRTVSRWRFIPARQNQVAVADWARVTIIFKLGT